MERLRKSERCTRVKFNGKWLRCGWKNAEKFKNEKKHGPQDCKKLEDKYN